MSQITRRTSTNNTEPSGRTAKRIISVIFIVAEMILAFRLIFKLLGANPESGFVKFIYFITQGFVGIFAGIFSEATTTGAETQSVFEPGTLIAMIIVALLAWIVMKLMTRNSRNSTISSETTMEDNPEKQEER